MGYSTTFYGELTIEPPAPWSKVKGSKFLGRDNSYCLWIEFSEETEDTEDGLVIRRGADRIVFCDDGHNHYEMTTDLQSLVDEIGPAHQFVGRIDCEGEDNDDMWRMKVIEGKVVKFKPEIVWPEASE